ncbi:unnamed protein product [Cylindrotheca closterium]|uniref:Symplekin C-terminal domain-containing protein n=1 Tax=Cylindrotheca closterium TaxID=2856 RepID=A0AAD2FVR8_9STRA|nr:unnamed protein product [Cylindrotheca closterium]
MFRERRGVSDLEDNLATLTGQQQDDDNMSDDDNAAPEMQSEAELEGEKEDPFLMAIDDLEGRVVAALDDVKIHPGVRSNSSQTVQAELATVLQPVMEVAAHTAPSVARTYYRGVGAEGVEASCEEVYQRVISDLVLPVLLEMAQSDTIPAKRGASLEFFRGLWRECHKSGSWLDSNQGSNGGPYGSGIISKVHHNTQQPRAQLKRRQQKRLAREAELLRYWVQASIACTTPGVFTSDSAEAAIGARGVIAASASIRPSLKHIAQRIRDADDRGANRVFGPVMKMVEGVLKKLFLNTNLSKDVGAEDDALRSACIKFLEIVCLCCSAKPQDSSSRKRRDSPDDFSLEDLPAGHPVITREALESIAEYAFSTLRGLALLGGQRKVDSNLLSEMLMGGNNSPSEQVVSILKPASLAFLEVESTIPPGDAENALEFNLDRANMEFDFLLSQKSYTLTINALATLSSNRPVFFKEGATCLGRRNADPPKFVEDGPLTKSAILAIQSQLRASCLTLLRNALSVQTKSSQILLKTLIKSDMKVQAEKAEKMAQQTMSLKTAGRAARNRANMFYEWETSADQRSSKRQRETDDALAKMRAAKAARGLGQGIQLPTSMADSIDLIMANLQHLPSKKPARSSKKQSSKQKAPATMDSLIDAIITNGASLTQEEGRWYSRDGGEAWESHMDNDTYYELSEKLLSTITAEDGPDKKRSKQELESIHNQKALFDTQCKVAASEAMGRIIANSTSSRYPELTKFANQVAAKLAWTLKDVPISSNLRPAQQMANDTIQSSKKRLASKEKQESLDELASSFPLVASCLVMEATITPESEAQEDRPSLGRSILDEAYANSCYEKPVKGKDPWRNYDTSLDLFVGSFLHSGERTNDKPTDNDRKRTAAHLSGSIQQQIGAMPQVKKSTFELLSAMCDTEDIAKKAADADRKGSQQTIAATASLHASKQAAEKRAVTVLLTIRDSAFQRDDVQTRRSAVEAAVCIASGSMNASKSCEDKALKLVMNVLFPKSTTLADLVVEAAVAELKKASDLAVETYDSIQEENAKNAAKENYGGPKGAFAPSSEAERLAMDKLRKPVFLFMALCIRRPEIIKKLFQISAVPKADTLSKTVRQNMAKLARAVATKHGAATLAMQVSDETSQDEIPLLLTFLEHLTPVGEKNMPSQELIDACFEIQEKKSKDGKKDPRFLIPIVCSMKRDELVKKLPEFVQADDDVFVAALMKMGERLSRHQLLFRDEPESDDDALQLKGLTLCEQLVYLHTMDFKAAGVPQKRYLDALRLCLENEEVFNDGLIMSSLDHMSGKFLTSEEKLPLAYMRTVILVCSKHESLHSWICHTLLPRLVEGKIYTEKRLWEGWMRCAKMLESNAGSGVSSVEAINQLPQEQLEIYRARYPPTRLN